MLQVTVDKEIPHRGGGQLGEANWATQPGGSLQQPPSHQQPVRLSSPFRILLKIGFHPSHTIKVPQSIRHRHEQRRNHTTERTWHMDWGHPGIPLAQTSFRRRQSQGQMGRGFFPDLLAQARTNPGAVHAGKSRGARNLPATYHPADPQEGLDSD